MKQTISLFCLFIAITFGSACSQSGGKAEAVALSAGEYEYLTKEYSKTPDAALEKGLSKEELFKKDTKVEFKNQDANYKFTAYKIAQGGTANAIFIKFEIDRLYTSLGLGSGTQRKQETRYFCIPSSASASTLLDSYDEAVQQLGYKDYEVFLRNLTELLREVYL
ncbi:MAG: hypothetical protein ACPG5B_12110 [Chitinophagales bacterium]